jgi:Ca2+-binding RTX toxin-like protein
MTVGLEIKLGHDRGGVLEGFYVTWRFGGRLFFVDEFDDTLIGGKGDDRLHGHGGDDLLIGGAGADLLVGGIGDDTLRGGGDQGDRLEGGEGDDWVDYSRNRTAGDADRTPIEIDLRFQMAWIGGGPGQAAGALVNRLISIENAIGGDGDDTIGGTAGDNHLVGRAGDDLLKGERGGDTLEGGRGADTLLGGDDFDTASFEGGAGPVTVSLGRGIAETRIAADRVERDILRDIEAAIGSHLDDTMFGWTGDEMLAGRGGGDTLLGFAGHDSLSGDDGDDVLSGGDNDDALTGGAGRDRLLGNDGDDLIFGDDDDDVIRGGDGADTLVGGDGRDRMTGGAGGDAFGFIAIADSPFGMEDEVTDLAGLDRLDIEEVIEEFLPELALRQNFLVFIGEKAFTKGGVHELRYDPAVGRLELDVNNSGAYDAGDFGVRLPKGLVLAFDGMDLAVGVALAGADTPADGIALYRDTGPTVAEPWPLHDPSPEAGVAEPVWPTAWFDEQPWDDEAAWIAAWFDAGAWEPDQPEDATASSEALEEPASPTAPFDEPAWTFAWRWNASASSDPAADPAWIADRRGEATVAGAALRPDNEIGGEAGLDDGNGEIALWLALAGAELLAGVEEGDAAVAEEAAAPPPPHQTAWWLLE